MHLSLANVLALAAAALAMPHLESRASNAGVCEPLVQCTPADVGKACTIGQVSGARVVGICQTVPGATLPVRLCSSYPFACFAGSLAGAGLRPRPPLGWKTE